MLKEEKRKRMINSGPEHKRWLMLNKFERKQKKLFLGRLTTQDSVRIFEDLCQFMQKLNTRESHNKTSLRKTLLLAEVHSMFMKVKP